MTIVVSAFLDDRSAKLHVKHQIFFDILLANVWTSEQGMPESVVSFI